MHLKITTEIDTPFIKKSPYFYEVYIIPSMAKKDLLEALYTVAKKEEKEKEKKEKEEKERKEPKERIKKKEEKKE